MAWISRTVSCAALAAVTAGAALADPAPGDTINVKGNAPAVCSLGQWIKDSGPGGFTGGTSPVISYGNGDLVDGSAHSIVGAGSTVQIHALLLCNTALSWQLTTAKGALRLDSGASATGFSNQWLYGLAFGPYDSGGARVGSFEDMASSDGTPFTGDLHGMSLSNSLKIARYGMTFTPLPQTASMLAGSYSETLTLTMSPLY